MAEKRKPANLIYGLDDAVPLPIRLLLGLQHSFHVTTALIFAIIVLQGMGASAAQAGFFISMSLLAGGIAVILQALNRKGVGSGYFAPSVCEPAYISASVMAAKIGGLPLVLGMTALGGVFEMLLSRVVHRLRRIFTPEVMGLVVTMVGISVIPVATRNFLGLAGEGGRINPEVLAVSLVTLGTMVAITVWSRGKLRLFSVIIGMATGYIVSFATGLLPAAHLGQILDKPLLAAPDFSQLSWSFDASLILPFLIASLCTSVKTIGNLTTCQKINAMRTGSGPTCPTSKKASWRTASASASAAFWEAWDSPRPPATSACRWERAPPAGRLLSRRAASSFFWPFCRALPKSLS